MRYLTFFVAALAATGCTKSSTDSGTASTPTITITAPADNGTVTPTSDNPDVPVSFTVTNFTLKDAGTCAGAADCGHVNILVDGTACDDAGKAYNATGSSSPITAGFDYCPTMSGAHTITAELHNDDDTAVKDANGTTVSSTVHVTAS